MGVGLAVMILSVFGWLSMEMRGMRSEMREAHTVFESRLDALERNQAILLERTKPLAPAKPQHLNREDQ